MKFYTPNAAETHEVLEYLRSKFGFQQGIRHLTVVFDESEPVVVSVEYYPRVPQNDSTGTTK